MKIHMNKNLRLLSIIAVAALISVVSYFLIQGISNPGYKEEISPSFKQENKINTEYEVFLKPNDLFNERVLSENQWVITEFVDYIRTSYTYDYTSEQIANITGNYEIIAVIDGYVGEEDKKSVVWNKVFILHPKTSFVRNESNQFRLKKDIDINLSVYNDFVKKIIEQSKINVTTKLSVFMNIDIKTETDMGIIEEKMSPNIVIPLNISYFKIEGLLKEDKPKSIDETKIVPLPVNYGRVYTFIACNILLLVMLVGILLFTVGDVKDSHEKLLDQILKKHGDRMVALKHKILQTHELQYEVMSIADLVRISDETGKPILYQYHNKANNICKFYVLNEKEMYILDIRDNEDDKYNGTEKDYKADALEKLKESSESDGIAIASWEQFKL